MKTRGDFKRTAKPNMVMQHSQEFVLETHISNAKLTAGLWEREKLLLRTTGGGQGNRSMCISFDVPLHENRTGCEAQGNWDFFSQSRAWKIWFWPMSHLMHRRQIRGPLLLAAHLLGLGLPEQLSRANADDKQKLVYQPPLRCAFAPL